jgi:hypothetical protein
MTLASLAPRACFPGSSIASKYDIAAAQIAVVQHRAANPNPPTMAQARLIVKRGYEAGPAEQVHARRLMDYETSMAFERRSAARDVLRFVEALALPDVDATFRAVCATEGLDADAAW